MKVLLDGRFLTEAEDAARAVAAARGPASATGRLIIGATLDGRELSADELTGGRGLCGREMAIVTARSGHLAAAALDAASRGLDHARARQEQAARMIQEGALAGCTEPLSDVLRLWQQARDAAELTLRLIEGRAAAGALSDRARGLSEDLGGCLGELKRTLASEDWSGLADTLAFDLHGLAGQWQEFLGELEAQVAAA